MDTAENSPPEEVQPPEVAGTPEPAPESAADPEADATTVAPTHSELDPEVAAAPETNWLAENWRWIGAGMLVVALLMYPVVRRVMDRPAATPVANPVATPTSNLPDLLTLSLQYYQAKRFPEAIAISKAILQINPNSADAYNNMGVSYAGLGQWDDAVASLQAALRINPNYQLAKNNLAWVASERQKSAPKEGTPEFFLNKSLLEYQANRFPESIAAAVLALRLRPDFPEAYNNMCVSYIGLHQYDAAIAACQNAVRVKPDFALAKNNMAWAMSEKQKVSKK
jgi:tetratricopeptide (TPR) repeat protein